MEVIRHFELAADALVPTYIIIYIIVVNCVFEYIKVNIIIGTHYIDTRIPELNVPIYFSNGTDIGYTLLLLFTRFTWAYSYVYNCVESWDSNNPERCYLSRCMYNM